MCLDVDKGGEVKVHERPTRFESGTSIRGCCINQHAFVDMGGLG